MKVVVLKRLVIGYGLLLTLAGGGLAFANIFGVIATVLNFGGETAPETSPIRFWMNFGWCFGVAIALIGAFKPMRKLWPSAESDSTIEPPSEPSGETPIQSKRHGLVASAAWGGFFGTLLGTVLGVSFILLWFSIACSPFGPNSWGASISVERERVRNSRSEELVSTTDHPVALYAMGIPIACGLVGGAIFGGIVRASD